MISCRLCTKCNAVLAAGTEGVLVLERPYFAPMIQTMVDAYAEKGVVLPPDPCTTPFVVPKENKELQYVWAVINRLRICHEHLGLTGGRPAPSVILGQALLPPMADAVQQYLVEKAQSDEGLDRQLEALCRAPIPLPDATRAESQIEITNIMNCLMLLVQGRISPTDR